MSGNKLLCLFGIILCSAAVVVAREAIISGNFAAPNQFPYQVSILIRGQNFLCGGAIIGNEFILTAAHCVVEPDNQFIPFSLNITAGSNNLQQNGPAAVRVMVDKIYVPREYNPEDRIPTGDIAVLRLRQSLGLHFHQHLRQLHLPENVHENFNGQRAVIAGWGWGWLEAAAISQHLRFAEADVISPDHDTYPRGRNAHNHICARLTQQLPRGVCYGDDGSPLVHNGIAIGILSLRAAECSEHAEAATYTRVSSYLRFIEDAIHERHEHLRVHHSPS